MTRDLSPDEARDEQLAMLREQHFAKRLGALVSGNQDAVRGVVDALSHKLCDDELMGQLVMLTVTDARQAGVMLNDLIERAVKLEAENDALREVEQMERQRNQEADEARADNARWDRAAV